MIPHMQTLCTIRASLLIAALAASTLSCAAAAPAAGMGASATPVASLKVAKDFKVELLYTVPKGVEGSWVAMCVDPKGRLIVSDQYGKLYRLTTPPLGTSDGLKLELIDLPLGQADRRAHV